MYRTSRISWQRDVILRNLWFWPLSPGGPPGRGAADETQCCGARRGVVARRLPRWLLPRSTRRPGSRSSRTRTSAPSDALTPTRTPGRQDSSRGLSETVVASYPSTGGRDRVLQRPTPEQRPGVPARGDIRVTAAKNLRGWGADLPLAPHLSTSPALGGRVPPHRDYACQHASAREWLRGRRQSRHHQSQTASAAGVR
jgi:hypothetical protein